MSVYMYLCMYIFPIFYCFLSREDRKKRNLTTIKKIFSFKSCGGNLWDPFRKFIFAFISLSFFFHFLTFSLFNFFFPYFTKTVITRWGRCCEAKFWLYYAEKYLMIWYRYVSRTSYVHILTRNYRQSFITFLPYEFS